MAQTLTSLPRNDGFRCPGEFEPKAGCWLGWPERPDVWRHGGKPAQQVWVAICSAIADSEPVTVCASAAQYANARAMLPPHIRVLEMSVNDAWFRDTGPAWLLNDHGAVRGVDFQFNAYGGLDGGLYFPWDRDAQIAQKILEAERVARYRAPFIAEMGGIQCDGEGTVLTTEQCLLNANRNARLGKEAMTQYLLDYLGASKVIWLPRGCKFDETDGHIDDLACFVSPGEVVMQWSDDPSDPQYDIYQEAYRILAASTDARGRQLRIHKLPAPAPLVWTAEEAAGLDHGEHAMPRLAGTRICASYINYYLGNSVLLVPEFGDPNDVAAQRVLAALFPQQRVIGIANAREILLGGGSLHCITSAQYAPQQR
ncbi:agmatine deiminase [Vogesella sp. GCM10023246]|uniref:Putative agmatine deiminase n=1 Tax=Vogesella oryzagri TaxID=3160864 RepID=A0ABV1M0C8_9NEIS